MRVQGQGILSVGAQAHARAQAHRGPAAELSTWGQCKGLQLQRIPRFGSKEMLISRANSPLMLKAHSCSGKSCLNVNWLNMTCHIIYTQARHACTGLLCMCCIFSSSNFFAVLVATRLATCVYQVRPEGAASY
uniref:Uncharacterized protein n=1 Tax=Eutreptiella gymnastica TaxID=73025 RepID=A0A7S4FD74_9EUGL